MKPEAGINRLRDSYLFAHLTYCILTSTCLVGWLKTTQMQLGDGYHFLWFICLAAALALIPAQHVIITKTFLEDRRHLHLYKALYTGTICVIYIPIITGIIAVAGLSILTIVPVILASIVCGTFYGMVTAMVMSATSVTAAIIKDNPNSTFYTEQVLLLALLVTTAWFIGQSFDYIKTLYQQLSTSENHLKKTLHSLGIATLNVNPSGQVDQVNTCFEELFDAENPVGREISVIIDRHLPFLKPGMARLGRDAAGSNSVFGQAVDSRGRLIPVQCIIYPVSSGLTDEGGYLICIHDISLTQKLEQEKVLTNYFIDFLNAGVIVCDAAGSIIELNTQAQNLLQSSRQETLGLNLAAFLGRLAGDETLPQKKESYEIDLGDRTLLINCADLCDKKGGIIGNVCIINDISSKKEMERKMQRSATLSAIGELAAGTAHEIRNPLTSIRGFLQLIKEKRDHRVRDLDHYFKMLLAEVDRINGIVVEFLKLARPQKPRLLPVDLNNIVDSIWDLLHNEAVLREVKLVRIQDPGLLRVKADPDMIKQVIINLVNNAIQACGPGGSVRVVTLSHRDGARLSVEDDGPGIDKSMLDRIFDPYFTTRDEGTGLGLAITSKIVHDHNGSIYVKSAPGRGAEFNVDFPAAPEDNS